MKAELTVITELIMEDKEKLAKALNDNFNAINDMAETREKAIFTRLGEIKRDLSTQIDTWSNSLKADLEQTMDDKIAALAKDLGRDPNDPSLLTD